MGSVLVARQAGSAHATSATITSIPDTATNVSTSNRPTPNSIVLMNRVSHNAPRSPVPTPAPARIMLRRTTSDKTFEGGWVYVDRRCQNDVAIPLQHRGLWNDHRDQYRRVVRRDLSRTTLAQRTNERRARRIHFHNQVLSNSEINPREGLADKCLSEEFRSDLSLVCHLRDRSANHVLGSTYASRPGCKPQRCLPGNRS
jgi:hypothetical protein